jgi:hypothetical protein
MLRVSSYSGIHGADNKIDHQNIHFSPDNFMIHVLLRWSTVLSRPTFNHPNHPSHDDRHFISVFVALLAFSSSIEVTPLRSSADALPVKTERTLAGKGSSKDSRRMAAPTRTTLINLDIDELSAEHIVFFEDTWMQLFDDILVVRGENDSDEDGPSVRSFVVDGVGRGSRPNVRRLKSSSFVPLRYLVFQFLVWHVGLGRVVLPSLPAWRRR